MQGGRGEVRGCGKRVGREGERKVDVERERERRGGERDNKKLERREAGKLDKQRVK